MNRRTTLIAPLALLGGATLPALFKAETAAAGETGTPGVIDGATYTKKVLQYGTLAKETSLIAKTRATAHYTQEFALGEILEQTAFAQSLTGVQHPKPVPLTPSQEADLDLVQGASAANFDQTYITVQIKGHESLLALQNGFLSGNPDYSQNLVHIALIARAFIRNHLYILRQLKSGAIPG